MDLRRFESQASALQTDTRTESPRIGGLVLDTALLERIAAGESLRSLGREKGVAHTTLSRRLQRPEGVVERRAVEQRLRLEQKRRSAKERLLEKELRRQAREQAARDRKRNRWPKPTQCRRSEFEAWLDQRDEPRGLASTDRMSINDELSAQTVTAGGGVQELIEATGLRTRLNVYQSIDPQIVALALANDGRRPQRERPDAGTSRRFVPDPALIARRAAGEPLRRLAKDAGVSPATLSRSFARPEIAEELRFQQLKLQEQRSDETEPDDQSPAAMLADHYASKISNIWCPVHRRRTYVTSVKTAEGGTRLEVAGCCEQAAQELVRWLKIHRVVLPTGAVFTPSGHAPASATVPPA
jgi:lambda repressor-like predicted transcriptional regulator